MNYHFWIPLVITINYQLSIIEIAIFSHQSPLLTINWWSVSRSPKGHSVEEEAARNSAGGTQKLPAAAGVAWFDLTFYCWMDDD